MDFFLLIVATAFLLFALYVARSRKRQKILGEACRNAFDNAYAAAEDKPAFHASYGYGVPLFKITHNSREAHERAETTGANEEFRRGIQLACGKSGSKTNPYQAARAIQFTWLMVSNEVFYPQAKHSGGASEA